MGCLSVIPVVICELLLGEVFPTDTENIAYYIINGDFITLFINILVSVALVEEFFKWLVIMKTSYYDSVMDEIYDGIVYGTFASLGFAVVENILYVITCANQYGLSFGFEIGLRRGLISIPGHASFGIMMGFFLGYAKLWKVRKNKQKTSIYLALSLIVPILLHAFYDALLMYNVNAVLFYLFIISLYILCFILVFKISKDDQVIFINRNNNYNPLYYQNPNVVSNYKNQNYHNYTYYCPRCGQPNNGVNQFCIRCGLKLR